MDGYDDDWSTWDEDTKRNYTNLNAGFYTFRVQSKNVYEHVGVEDVFRFKVLPPSSVEESQKKQIFISYSHHDKEFVNRLTIDLGSAGIGVWVDEKEIKVGESISQKVEKGISSCDFFCLVISRHSVNSSWVEREYRIALNKQLSGTTPIILPLRIQDVELPVLLGDTKYADFSMDYDSGLKELLNCDEILSKVGYEKK